MSSNEEMYLRNCENNVKPFHLLAGGTYWNRRRYGSVCVSLPAKEARVPVVLLHIGVDSEHHQFDIVGVWTSERYI